MGGLIIGVEISKDLFKIEIDCLGGEKMFFSQEMAKALKNLNHAICNVKCDLDLLALPYDGKKIMIPHSETKSVIVRLNSAFDEFKVVMEAQGYHAHDNSRSWVDVFDSNNEEVEYFELYCNCRFSATK